MKKILFLAAVVLILVAGIFFIIRKSSPPAPETGKISVVTSLFPLYDFAKNIGGEKADVFLLLPPGVEAHSFEPTPSDIGKINRADIFIYAGAAMEPWAADILAGATNKNLITVDASSGVALIPAVFHDTDEPAGAPDPHYWLDFNNTKIMVDEIGQALAEAEPAEKNYFEQNAAAYKTALTDLDNEYKKAFTACRTKKIVYGGHYAFGYLAARYGLKYSAAQGIAPDAEPTAADLAGLVNQIRQEKINYVFYEELTSPKIAETLAKETGAKLLLLNAAHNVSRADLAAEAGFIDIMKKNLANLKIGLECGQ